MKEERPSFKIYEALKEILEWAENQSIRDMERSEHQLGKKFTPDDEEIFIAGWWHGFELALELDKALIDDWGDKEK